LQFYVWFDCFCFGLLFFVTFLIVLFLCQKCVICGFCKEGAMSVTENTLLSDIQEVNLSYLMLAQRLLRENFAAGMYRLGFDADVAETVLRLSPAQLVKLSASNTLLCAFRLNDYELLSTLTQDVLGGVLQQAHSTILLSQRTMVSA
jgi:flagellar transcriptional activator FlhD